MLIWIARIRKGDEGGDIFSWFQLNRDSTAPQKKVNQKMNNNLCLSGPLVWDAPFHLQPLQLSNLGGEVPLDYVVEEDLASLFSLFPIGCEWYLFGHLFFVREICLDNQLNHLSCAPVHLLFSQNRPFQLGATLQNRFGLRSQFWEPQLELWKRSHSFRLLFQVQIGDPL